MSWRAARTAAFFFAAIAPACTTTTETCLPVGISSYVQVNADPAASVTGSCVDGRCINAPGAPLVFPVDTEPATYDFTIRLDDGTTPRDVSGQVTTERVEYCGSVSANAIIEVDASGQTGVRSPFTPGTPPAVVGPSSR